MEQRNWLEDVAIVNESRDERVAGGVLVFRNAGDACSHLEHWWVENAEGFAFTALGDRLILGVDPSGRVVVERREACMDGGEIVESWLRHSAGSVLAARRHRSAARWRTTKLGEVEARGVLPDTIEGLIAYIGFTR